MQKLAACVVPAQRRGQARRNFRTWLAFGAICDLAQSWPGRHAVRYFCGEGFVVGSTPRLEAPGSASEPPCPEAMDESQPAAPDPAPSLSLLLAALANAGPGTALELAPGRYVLERPLLFDTGLLLRAHGVTLVAPAGEVAVRVTTPQPVVIEGLRIEASSKTAIEVTNGALTLRSCILCGPGYVKELDGAHGVHLIGGEGTIEAGIFSGFDCGICVAQSANARIDRLVARENDIGIGATSGGHALIRQAASEENRVGVAFYDGGRGEISHSILSRNKRSGGYVNGETHVTIRECLAAGNQLDGLHASAGNGSVNFVRNVVRASGRHGIYVGGEFKVQIAGNAVEGSGRVGIWADANASGEVRHNFVAQSAENGIDSVGATLRANVSIRNGYAAYAFGGTSTAKALFNFGARSKQNGAFVTGQATPHADLQSVRRQRSERHSRVQKKRSRRTGEPLRNQRLVGPHGCGPSQTNRRTQYVPWQRRERL